MRAMSGGWGSQRREVGKSRHLCVEVLARPQMCRAVRLWWGWCGLELGRWEAERGGRQEAGGGCSVRKPCCKLGRPIDPKDAGQALQHLLKRGCNLDLDNDCVHDELKLVLWFLTVAALWLWAGVGVLGLCASSLLAASSSVAAAKQEEHDHQAHKKDRQDVDKLERGVVVVASARDAATSIA